MRRYPRNLLWASDELVFTTVDESKLELFEFYYRAISLVQYRVGRIVLGLEVDMGLSLNVQDDPRCSRAKYPFLQRMENKPVDIRKMPADNI